MTEQQEPQVTSSEPTTLPTPKHRGRRILKWSMLCFLGVLLLVISSVFTLFYSQTAQQKLLAFVDRQLDALSIQQISGNLRDGLQLEQVRYQTQGINVSVQQANLQLNPNCLWHAQVCIDQINLLAPNITIDTAQLPPSETEETHDERPFTMPIAVEVNQLQIAQLTLQLDNQLLMLDHVVTGLSATPQNHFHLLPTSINGLQWIETVSDDIQLPLVTTEAESAPSQPTDWNAIKQQLQQPLLNPQQQIHLPFTFKIDDLHAQDWLYQKRSAKGEILSDLNIPTIVLQAQATPQQIELSQLQLQSSLLDLNAHGQIQTNETAPIALHLDGKLHQQTAPAQQKKPAQIVLPASEFQLEAQGNLYEKLTLFATIKGLADAQLTTQLYLTQAKLPLNVDLKIDQAQYPLTLQPDENPATDQIRLVKTHLTATGDLLNYQATLQGNVEGMHSPTVDVDLTGYGSIDQFTIQQATLQGLNGNVNLQSHVSWQNGVAWNSQLKLQHLNVYRYFHSVDWLATLSGELVSSGKVDQQGWQVNVPIINLTGNANNQAITINGDIALSNQIPLSSQHFDFRYGKNQLSFYGKLAQESQFQLTVDAPNFSGLYKGLDLAAKGNIHITGDIQRPHLDVDLTVPHLKSSDLLLQQAKIAGKIQSDQQNIRGQLELKLNQLKYADSVQLSQIALNANGDEQQHQLKIRSQGKPVALNLDLQGAFDRHAQTWQAQLTQSQIHTLIGNFIANQPIQINYADKEQQAKISAHCWKHQSLPLCFPQPFTVGVEGHIPFKLQNANLAFLRQFLTDKTQLQSQFNLNGTVNWYQDKPFDMNWQLDSSRFKLTQNVDFHQFNLDLNKLASNGQIKDNKLSVKNEINIRNNGSLESNITLDDLTEAQKLGGNIKIKKIQLALINQLLNSGDRLNGDINADLNLTGTLTTPLIHGKLSLNRLNSSMPTLPFTITNGFVDLNFHGNRSNLTGEIITQEGKLRLQGESDWQQLAHWSAKLSASSDNFALTIPDMAKLTIKPNIQIHAQPHHLNIDGNVDIPFANIEIEQLPENAINVSDDEVILDQKPKRSAKQQLADFREKTNAYLSTNITINLGQRVRVSAYGLKSQLEGILNVRQKDDQFGLFGQIQLVNGRYASFGQDLLIRKGEIIFSGLPSQPTLNIEAIRNPTAMETNLVTVGIRVSGLAQSPAIQVFAEPSMSQDNALSYLLTGRSLSSENTGSSASLGAALISLSLSKTGKMVGQIGETFGIKNLNLETQGLGEQSQVVVSGYITPRLQVKYGVGLFEPLAELTLRYRLLPKLYLQSVSGTSQAVDLLYQFEH